MECERRLPRNALNRRSPVEACTSLDPEQCAYTKLQQKLYHYSGVPEHHI